MESALRYIYGRPAVHGRCVAEARATALAEVDRVASLRARSGRSVAAN